MRPKKLIIATVLLTSAASQVLPGALFRLAFCSCCCSLCRLFKGITPLWGRQIPYTMMKFGTPPCLRCLRRI